MDFNSVGSGSPFYILRRADKPVLETGIVKSKTIQQPKYNTAVPNAFAGMNTQQYATITVTIGGAEETFSDVPLNVEVASKGNDVFTGSREAMMQVVDSMVQSSKKALEMIDYHKIVKIEGEKMFEILNPRYAEEKKQAKTISELEKRQSETDRKLDRILELLGGSLPDDKK